MGRGFVFGLLVGLKPPSFTAAAEGEGATGHLSCGDINISG